MITTSKQTDSSTRHDHQVTTNHETRKLTTKPPTGTTTTAAAAAATTTATWSRLKDPRIVRVSRAFGGKDRHSKVCTIRGLRDRRVRLSVPTAIQLYDLQDRLGLNQPSKVVDWLLEAAKDEIDELPPLPVSPESFSLNHHQSSLLGTRSLEVGNSSQPNKDEFKMSSWEDQNGLNRSGFWGSDWRAKNKDVPRDIETIDEKDNWCKRDETQQKVDESNDFLARSSLPGGLMYGSYYHQIEQQQQQPPLGNHGFTNQQSSEDLQNFNVMPSSLSLSSSPSGRQMLVSMVTQTQHLFPSPDTGSMDIDINPRHMNDFQMLSNADSSFYSLGHHNHHQSMRPTNFHHFGMNSRFFNHSDNNGDEDDNNINNDNMRQNQQHDHKDLD